MLSIQELSHTYPNGVRALNGISLEVPRGMFGLLGPNGAGKSSLMRTIATLQQPTSGSIQFGDIDVLTEPEGLRRVLGYLPQEFGVYPRGSALEILNHLAVLKGITNRKQRRSLVEKLLVQTNLFDVRKKRLANFSGGMRQRFGIAQVLIGEPKLIIVDEPTAGLDPEDRNRFHTLLAEIGEDIVVILSTHIVEDVSVLCPNMAILAAGRVAAQGTPTGLIADLVGHIWEKKIDKSDLDECKSAHNVISTNLKGGELVVRAHALSSPGIDFVSAPPTLEDVYFFAMVSGSEAGSTRVNSTVGASTS
jgi:ABC-2 type transport system ATP-binding protein